MAGKSGRSINNVPESPVKKMIFSWEGILVLLFYDTYLQSRCSSGGLLLMDEYSYRYLLELLDSNILTIL